MWIYLSGIYVFKYVFLKINVERGDGDISKLQKSTKTDLSKDSF